MSDFTKAIELDPANATSYNSRGLVYDKMERYELAILDFTKVSASYSVGRLVVCFFMGCLVFV